VTDELPSSPKDWALWWSNPRRSLEDVTRLLLDPATPIQALECPSIPTAWFRHSRVRALLSRHPHTPMGLSQTLLPELFWRDLMEICDNHRLAPPLRRMAEKYLVEKFEKMPLGQKIALARQCGRSLIKHVRVGPHPRVGEALLNNARFTEEDALFLSQNSRTTRPVLEALARSGKWGRRAQVLFTLAKNTRTPRHVALNCLSLLDRPHCDAIANDHQVPRYIRLAASRLSGRKT